MCSQIKERIHDECLFCMYRVCIPSFISINAMISELAGEVSYVTPHNVTPEEGDDHGKRL